LADKIFKSSLTLVFQCLKHSKRPQKGRFFYRFDCNVYLDASPVIIPRDSETLEHLQIKGLYSCGEGAGYAGGIISAAIDGEKCAMKVAQILNKIT
jgi:hypothetical protein